MKTTFSYSPYFRISNIFLSVFMIFLAGNLGYLLFRVLATSLNGVQVQTETFVWLSIVVLIMLLNVVIYLNWQPDFVVQDEGIVVKVYHFWEKTIPWENVIDVKHSWIPITGKQIYVVVVRRLTPLHSVIGMLYGLTTKPAFVITRALEEREKAASLINSHVKKKSSKVK
jgi:hypothetical protein